MENEIKQAIQEVVRAVENGDMTALKFWAEFLSETRARLKEMAEEEDVNTLVDDEPLASDLLKEYKYPLAQSKHILDALRDGNIIVFFDEAVWQTVEDIENDVREKVGKTWYAGLLRLDHETMKRNIEIALSPYAIEFGEWLFCAR